MNTVIESLNAWGSNFVQFAWPMLLQSAVVIAVVLGLNWALRRHVRAVVRYALLLLMLVKLVLPPSFALPTGAGNWLSLDRTPLAQAPAEVAAAPKAVTPAEPIVPMPDVASERLATSSLQPLRASLSWQAVLFVCWVAGMTVLLGLVVRRFRSVARLVASEAPAGLQEVVEFCRAKLAVRQPVVVRFSSFPSSPAVCGLLRPVILVPKALVESFSPEQLEAVLLHELGHIKRGDLWVSHLQTLLQILYWYNPLLWAGNMIIRRVREEAVDELVMVTMKSQAGTYPGTLLAVAKLGFMRRLSGLGLVGIAESNRGLKERIQKLVSRPIPKTAKLGVFGVLTVTVIASVVLPLAQPAHAVIFANVALHPSNTNQFAAKTNFTARLGDGFVATVLAVAPDAKTITLVSSVFGRTNGAPVVYEVTPETKILKRGEPAALEDAVVGEEIRYRIRRGAGFKPMLVFLELKPAAAGKQPAVTSGTDQKYCPADPRNRLAGDPSLTRTVDCNQCHMRHTDENGTRVDESKLQSERCPGFLKYIGLSARVWATNHNGVMPSDFASMTNGLHYRLTSLALLFCNSGIGRRTAPIVPPASWAEFNPAETPYQLVSPGTSITNSSAVYIRCRIHEHALLVDGSVVAATAKR